MLRRFTGQWHGTGTRGPLGSYRRRTGVGDRAQLDAFAGASKDYAIQAWEFSPEIPAPISFPYGKSHCAAALLIQKRGPIDNEVDELLRRGADQELLRIGDRVG